MRLLTILATLLLVAAPVSADHSWRPHFVHQFEAMDAELQPVLVRTRELREGWPAVIAGLADNPSVASLASNLERAQAGLMEMEAIASDGLEIMSRYSPAACWVDSYSVTLTGFLLLGDAGQDDADSGQRYGAAMYLLLDYGEDVRDIEDCE